MTLGAHDLSRKCERSRCRRLPAALTPGGMAFEAPHRVKRVVVWLMLTAALVPGVRAVAQSEQKTSAADAVVTAPVHVDGDVLFHVRGVSSLPAADRARRIRDQLLAVARDSAIAPESLKIVDTQGISRIQSGSRVVAAVVEADAELEQVERSLLAQVHLERLQHGIRLYRTNRSAAARWQSVTRALIATGVLLVTVVLLLWGRRRVDRFLVGRLDERIRSVEKHSFKVMPADRIWDAVRNALRAIRTILIVAIVLIYAGYVLAQFPNTRALSNNMTTFAVGPLNVMLDSVLQSIPSLLFLVVLFVVFRLLLRVVRLFFTGLERGAFSVGSFDPDWAQPTYKILRIALIAFALVVAYPYIPGSGTAAFQGISIFIGIVFSLGSSTALANIIAGYMLIYRRAFKIGDVIKVGDHMGQVIGTRLQVTQLRTPKNEEIIIPNSEIMSSDVVNFSSIGRLEGVILHTEVRIGYATPWRQVEAMLAEAAHRTKGLGTDPRPFVLERQLGEFAVTYELNVYCTNVGAMRALYAALHRNVLDVFNEHGVQIMTPAYEGDPEHPKVVDPKNWFTPPAKADA